MPFSTTLILGVCMSWTACSMNSLANVLFKYNVEYPKSRPCVPYLSWHHVAICILVGGSFMSIGAIAFLPISMASAGSALPIVFGEIWSGWLLPHTKLNCKQWVIIFCIVSSVGGVAFFGDHGHKSNVMDDFLENVWTPHGFAWLLTTMCLAILCFILIFLTSPQSEDEEIKTCSVVNIIGPLLPGSIGNFTQICVRIGSVALLCAITSCGEHYPYFIYFLGVLIPVFAISQLHFLGIVMSKLNLTTAIPLYQSSLIILPALSGIFILGERPWSMRGYVSCIIFALNALIVFVRDVSQSEEKAHLVLIESASEEISIEVALDCVNEPVKEISALL